jgi:segregation and condensation protein B
LIEEAGREETPGRPVLYGTTQQFLERLGLPSLAALPSLAPLLGPDAADASLDLTEDVLLADGPGELDPGRGILPTEETESPAAGVLGDDHADPA